jgi:4-hydroxybenzoate polyprenyltransferase
MNNPPLTIVAIIFLLVAAFCTVVNTFNDGAGELFKTPIAFVFIGLSLALYFLPSYIAYEKKKKNAGAIFALNLLTGWTVIGWVIGLVWAFAND